MILFKNVSKRYPNGNEALSQINLQLSSGEMAFVTGQSGSGKSTLIKVAAGIEMADKGNVVVEGINLKSLTPKRIPPFRRQLGLILQNPLFMQEHSVLTNVALPLEILGYRRTDANRRARLVLEKLGLLERENCLPPALSYGESQRVNIARAMVHQPNVILADEPTGNLDPAQSRHVLQLLLEMNALGTTVLITSNDLTLVARYKQRIITLEKGKAL